MITWEPHPPREWGEAKFWHITFRGGVRTGWAHESMWVPDKWVNDVQRLGQRVQLVIVPKPLYKAPEDLPTHRREIDLYPEFRNPRR